MLLKEGRPDWEKVSLAPNSQYSAGWLESARRPWSMEDSPVSGGETQSTQQAVVEAIVGIGGLSQLYVARCVRVTLVRREDCSKGILF